MRTMQTVVTVLAVLCVIIGQRTQWNEGTGSRCYVRPCVRSPCARARLRTIVVYPFINLLFDQGNNNRKINPNKLVQQLQNMRHHFWENSQQFWNKYPATKDNLVGLNQWREIGSKPLQFVNILCFLWSKPYAYTFLAINKKLML